MTIARKRFGQHFLEDAWARKVVNAINPDASHTFLEIGPGRGALTRPLVASAAHVIAFEIDRDLVADLSAAHLPRLTIVPGDFLQTTSARIDREFLNANLTPTVLRAAGNLPYNVAAPILFKLVELYDAGLPLVDATVMVQREVADRLVARPGTKEYGVLSVLIRHHARVERKLDLPPGAFRPAPKVRSTVVRLVFHTPDPRPRDPVGFEALVHAAFGQRRKMIANAIASHSPASKAVPVNALARAEIDPRRRPETLEIAEWVRLSDAVYDLGTA